MSVKDIHPIFDVSDGVVLTPDLIAEMLCLNPATVRSWCRNGKLPSYSFGGKYVIVGSDFKRFMKNAKRY